MFSITRPDATRPGAPTTSPAGSRRGTLIAAALTAATLTLTLAACGGGSDAASGDIETAPNVVEVLAEAERNLPADQIPSQEEARAQYEEWLAGKARRAEAAGRTAAPATPDRPLAVGDCTDHVPTATELTAADIPAVDCAGEHLTEVYRAVALAQLGEAYPRESEIVSMTQDGCEAGFTEYVGSDWLGSELTYAIVTPTRASWGEGDTTALCIVYPMSFEPFSGTLQDAKR